jgi:dephospho-CoA kinase
VSAPLQIGITGGIGSGKTLVCKIFQRLGIPVYDSDHRAKSLMTTDGILISNIKKEFGDLSYDSSGKLNRQFLSDLVFKDEGKLQILNNLVHPRVAEDYRQWLSKNHDVPYVLKEAALLFESGSYKHLDKIIVVFAEEQVRIRRVMERDKRSFSQVESILINQWPDSEKVNRADYVLYNDGSRLLIPQVLSLHQQLSTFKN